MKKLLCACVAILMLPALGAAQARQSPWMPSIGGGVIEWNETGLSTNSRNPGGATAIVLRGSRNVVGRIVGFEWGGAYASFDDPTYLDPTQTFALDWRLMVHTPWQAVQPFAGVGPSLVMYGTNYRGRDAFYTAYNVGAGLRVQATPGLVLIIDGRIRGWDFSGTEQLTQDSAGEVTLSLGFRR